MIVKCILLALSASIDALGLGITYGIKKTKMSSVGNLIIFVVLFMWREPTEKDRSAHS